MSSEVKNARATATVYRYKLSDEIVSALTTFSKIHKYDDRITYKESWEAWVKLNQDSIDKEKERLENLGYIGDVQDKMFKAARYYFRKKRENGAGKSTENLIEDIEGDEREDIRHTLTLPGGYGGCPPKYISLGFCLLDAIESHIIRNINNLDYSPASGWEDFYKNNERLVLDEITDIIKNRNIDKSDAILRVKKSYKNKYFQHSRKTQNNEK